VAVILSAFLLAGGLGSYRSRAAAGDGTALRKKCAVLVGLLLIMTVALPAIIETALPLGLGGRLLVTVLVVAPMGYLMGQLSVLGSILTLVLAINFGYTTTMLVGPAAYLVAAVVAEELQ
jgi:hypothetical protein